MSPFHCLQENIFWPNHKVWLILIWRPSVEACSLGSWIPGCDICSGHPPASPCHLICLCAAPCCSPGLAPFPLEHRALQGVEWGAGPTGVKVWHLDLILQRVRSCEEESKQRESRTSTHTASYVLSHPTLKQPKAFLNLHVYLLASICIIWWWRMYPTSLNFVDCVSTSCNWSLCMIMDVYCYQLLISTCGRDLYFRPNRFQFHLEVTRASYNIISFRLTWKVTW